MLDGQAAMVDVMELPQARITCSRKVEMSAVSMQTDEALAALAALAHPTRLEVFRLLIRQGPIGMPAGQIAEALSIGPSTLSPHLAQLNRAGLATSWRNERRIYYAFNVEGMRRLLAFLTQECCQGHPELCRGLQQATRLLDPQPSEVG